MLLISLLCLLVFGPGKLTSIARDLGGFVRKARESVEEFRSEFALDEYREGLEEPTYGDWDAENPKFDESEDLPKSRAIGTGVGSEAPAEGSSGAPWSERDSVGSVDDDGSAPEPARVEGKARG